jgi:predicted nucleotidyltransferase component of viral defense system
VDKNNPYFEQVRLLVEVLPVIARRNEFALKGGTAINLFLRDMPRLSVDIDLVYVPVQEREKSLTIIDYALIGIEEELGRGASGMVVKSNYSINAGKRDKLIILRGESEIKVEVATNLRGSLFPPEIRSAGPKVREWFGPVEMPLLRFEEVFAGKICAALDRQHPRDLFDIHHLLENEGITRELMTAFIAYLLSSPRPMSELLDPTPKNLERIYRLEFAGMTESPVHLDALIETRWNLVAAIHENLTDSDREFLISMKSGSPDWRKFEIPGVEKFPAVMWKIHNLNSMEKTKRDEAMRKLSRVLEPGHTFRCRPGGPGLQLDPGRR